MLRPAQLYEEQLNKAYIGTWYDEGYKFYEGASGSYSVNLPDNNQDSHNFVSVDEEDNVIGYISYSVDWSAMSVSNIGIISFDKGNMIFGRDVFKIICDIFEKYGMNRVNWWCYEDNPAVNSYRNFIRNHGGKECGHLRQVSKLRDGKLHDIVEFEILSEEFHR